MTIYIAICDDNAADRKHLERMLNREKDARLHDKNDVLYIDSFGSDEALMRTPIKYDVFFLDVTTSSANGMDIAKQLRKKGIVAPIVLCTSTIDYSSFVNAPKDIIILEKPLNQGQISHITDVALDYTKSKTPLIEIRGQKDTFFVKYNEIVRAESKGKFSTDILLSDGSSITMLDSIKSLYRLCKCHGCFVFCGKILISALHITSFDNNGFKLTGGEYVSFTFNQKKDIINALVRALLLIKNSGKDDFE